MHYFVRVNGKSRHVNSDRPKCFVPGEPPGHPVKGFNYLRYCLTNGIIRIGWPDTGDLSAASKTGSLADCYRLSDLESRHQSYLRGFAGISVGSTILMPDAD